MNRLCTISLVLSLICGFSTAQEIKLEDYTFPAPEKFGEFVDLTEADGRRKVSEYFRAYGISIPPGGNITFDQSKDVLRARLPKEEALKMVEILNHCIVHTSARFFRGSVDSPNQENDEKDAKDQFVIPQNLAGHTGITIHFEKRTGEKITCVIANHTEQPTWFGGWSVKSPSYRIQEFIDGRWVNFRIIYDDDLGLRTPKLFPKRACRFEFDLPKTDKPIRVGIALLDDVSIQKKQNTIWTSTIPGSTLK